ncbi:MAG: hypothetical protein IPQ06_10445 [Chitinophagaceae bacterium]|nr:hypothetical protein [Chitinophagaceae bacterium]MBK9570042.1 hypothetical protein [Chitinophagaceae bacterium]MBL0273467.1 hypothetical protein [Chitinophagaceae bacterium]
MRTVILFLFIFSSLAGAAQKERDTVLGRCPVYVTDTSTSNNFFIEARPATLKVYRVKGDLTIVVEQKDQFFTMFFRDKRLKNGKYKISISPDGRSELAAKYSFRTGEQVSFVNVASGSVDVLYDKEKKLWRLKVNGMIANLVERSISYYKVRADFSIK